MENFALLLAVAETVFLLLAVFAIVFVLRRMRRSLSAAAPPDAPDAAPFETSPAPHGDWKDIARHFPAGHGPAESIAHRATIAIGAVRWKNCVEFAAGAVGLRMTVKIPLLGALGRPPVEIPWSEIFDDGPERLYWAEARALVVGRPPIARIVVPAEVAAALRRRGHLAA